MLVHTPLCMCILSWAQLLHTCTHTHIHTHIHTHTYTHTHTHHHVGSHTHTANMRIYNQRLLERLIKNSMHVQRTRSKETVMFCYKCSSAWCVCAREYVCVHVSVCMCVLMKVFPCKPAWWCVCVCGHVHKSCAHEVYTCIKVCDQHDSVYACVTSMTVCMHVCA